MTLSLLNAFCIVVGIGFSGVSMGFLKLRPTHCWGMVKKMGKKICISLVVVALLLVGVIATSVVASSTGLASNSAVSKEEMETVSQVSIVPEDVDVLDLDIEDLKRIVPDTYEEVDVQVSITRVRFLLYTDDGKHIMWGYVGNGYFVGEDNMDKRCWGIYGKGVFAGFYDGEFFWGKYNSGDWKAIGFFGLNCAQGKYILFPTISTDASVIGDLE